MKSVNIRRLPGDLALLFLTFTLMSASYIFEIAPKWGYFGFELDINVMRAIFSLSILAFFLFFIPHKLSTRSFLMVFSIYAYLLPSLVVFSFGSLSEQYILAVFIGFTLFFGFSNLNFRRPKFAAVSGKTILASLIFIIVLVIFFQIYLGGLRNFNLNIFQVYEYRRAAASALPAIFGYLLSPVAKVFIPVGIALGLYYKSKIAVVIFIVLTFIFFGLTHHKSVLFAPFLIVVVFLVIHKSTNIRALHFLFFFVAAVGAAELLVSNLLFGSSGTNYFSTLITRRVFFIPPLLDSFYINFFSENDLVMWSTSRITFNAVESSYDLTAPFLIGEQFFGRVDMSANTGFIGSGYSNGGLFGVAIYGSIIGIIISVLNTHGRYLGHPITISASLIVFTTLMTSSDLVTVIITHGLLLLLIMLAFMPKSTPVLKMKASV